MLTPNALREIQQLSNEARSLASGNQRSRKEADIILAKIAAINHAGVSTDEARKMTINATRNEMGLPDIDWAEVRKQGRHEELFKRFVRGGALHEIEAEARDLAAGSQTITYTDGTEGGFLVPQSVYETLILGMSAVTPLLDETIVTIKKSPDTAALPGQPDNGNSLQSLRPIVIPAWDTTQITAFRLGENTQVGKGSPMTAHGTQLNSYAYRTQDVAVPFEFEQDSFQDVMNGLTQMFSIGLARGCGADLQYGTGSNEPTGLITAAESTGIEISLSADGPGGVATSPILSALEEVFFSVDKVHRGHPSCSWVTDDGTWAAIRRLAPSAARPLAFDEGEDQYPLQTNCAGRLLGKRVLIDNNLAGSNGSNPLANIVFGNLSRFVVRMSGGIRIKRNLESVYVTSGQALYTALMRLDSNIVAAGDTPIVTATVGS
jgi:HK97 family phage major capsid protein